ERPAEVVSLTSPPVESAGAAGALPQNRAVVGAFIRREGTATQTFVVAAAATAARPADTLSYGVPGAKLARHVVFDAPEDEGGRAAVSAAPGPDGRCLISLSTTGPMLLTGRPLVFSVEPASTG